MAGIDTWFDGLDQKLNAGLHQLGQASIAVGQALRKP